MGDIPGAAHLRNGRRAASREELTSNGRIQSQTKTLSRSFSVLAPWRPKHPKEAMELDYTQYQQRPKTNGKYEQKVTRNSTSRRDSSSTLKKKAAETKRSNQNNGLSQQKSRSKENISAQNSKRQEGDGRTSLSTLYRKNKEKQMNGRYSNEDKKKIIGSKSMSVESLGSGRKLRREDREVSRSISMPRHSDKEAGWFKMDKSSKKTGSTQRL